jgi:hypothetical protein
MGLDMFLMAKRGLYSVSEPDKAAIAQAINMPYSHRWEVGQVVCEAGYWRKVNAIHNWFVENVQHGEDECREHRVSREQLLDLLNAVDEVLETEDEDERTRKAVELLPPTSGFSLAAQT